MRENVIRMLTMITGIFAALVIVFSQFLFFQTGGHHKNKIKTENQEKKKSSEAKKYLSLPSISQPSSHVEVTPKSSSCLFEILFEEGQEETYSDKVPLSFNKFFQTLFRVIVPSNAP